MVVLLLIRLEHPFALSTLFLSLEIWDTGDTSERKGGLLSRVLKMSGLEGMSVVEIKCSLWNDRVVHSRSQKYGYTVYDPLHKTSISAPTDPSAYSKAVM